MTAQYSSDSESQKPLTDDDVVREVLSELTTPTSAEIIERQNQLAWQRDRATIEDFFNQPSKYIKAYWQKYKPIVITLLIIASALFVINLLLAIIGTITEIPLFGGLLEIIGLGYFIWFAKHYLIKASTRQKLVRLVEQFKQEIIGTTEQVTGDMSLNAKKSVVIKKSPEELYRFWRNFENLPRFMNHLESVNILDDKHSHWVAKAPLDTTVEWDAEIVDEKENKSIVWKSREGAQVDSVGSVAFTSANGSGTQVKVTMKYNPPAGVVGAVAAAIFGENPQQQLHEDLERFKQVTETEAA